MWTRLREFAVEVDKHSIPTRKEKFLQTFGIKRKMHWLGKVDGIHPDLLESYRQKIVTCQRRKQQPKGFTHVEFILDHTHYHPFYKG